MLLHLDKAGPAGSGQGKMTRSHLIGVRLTYERYGVDFYAHSS
jgi:hypothetical protein